MELYEEKGECTVSGGVEGKTTVRSSAALAAGSDLWHREAAADLWAESPAVSQRDKRRQIGCFPDRQGDNRGLSVCKQERSYLSPPDDGVNTSVYQPMAPAIALSSPSATAAARQNMAARERRRGWLGLPEFFRSSPSQPLFPGLLPSR